MKALVLNALGHGFDFEDVEIALPRGREVLVDVQASGPCHTDLLFATHDIAPTSSVLGHEVAGTVAAIGPDVTHFRFGDHVVLTVKEKAMKTITKPETNKTLTTHYIDGAFVESHGLHLPQAGIGRRRRLYGRHQAQRVKLPADTGIARGSAGGQSPEGTFECGDGTRQCRRC
jgi:threonine dehydrogenase-like Zn-dependent dehydrogenase